MYAMLLCHPELLQYHVQYVATRFIFAAQILANHIFESYHTYTPKQIIYTPKGHQSHLFGQYLARKKNDDFLIANCVVLLSTTKLHKMKIFV